MKQKEMRVDLIPIHEIRIAERIRRDNGSLDDLALDIQEHGLLNPITVMEQADGRLCADCGSAPAEGHGTDRRNGYPGDGYVAHGSG